MKISFYQFFKMGVAIGLGYELGRVGMMTLHSLTKKKTREDFKAEYKRRLKSVPDDERVKYEDYDFKYKTNENSRIHNVGIRAVMDPDEIRDIKYPNDPRD